MWRCRLSHVNLQQLETMPHREKQEVLAQLPVEYGGQLLDQLHGHEYEDYIDSLIPEYCGSWPYLKAGGEQEIIVLAGRAGRRYGMERIARYPFKLYTSGSTPIVQEGIVLVAKAKYLHVIREGWGVEQKQELRHPSASLNDCVSTPDEEEEHRYETIPDPSQLGDPVGEMLEMDAFQAAFSKLTRDTRKIVQKWLSGREIAMIASERRESYGTVQRRLHRAMRAIHEELSQVEMPDSDRDAAIGDAHRQLLEKVVGDVPP